MAGDTAQTIASTNPRGMIQGRAFLGLIKVLPIHKLQAGLSYWGWAKMPPQSQLPDGRWMDWWVQDFIDRREKDFNSLKELAFLLETELRKFVPPLSGQELEECPLGNGGIHLAGFSDYKGSIVPDFWHIHNGFSQALSGVTIDPRIVNANHDQPPRQLEKGRITVVRNGDIEAYVTLFERHLVGYLGELRKEQGLAIPFPSLAHHAEFWASQIRFISALYEAGGLIEDGAVTPMAKEIGDQITTLTISSQGIRSYYTR